MPPSQGGGGTTVQQSQQNTNGNSSSSSAPPAFLQPYLQNGVSTLNDIWGANPNAPTYYPGQTVASFSPQTQQALSMAGGIAGSATPGFLTDAEGQVSDTVNGKYLDPTTNPDFLKAISAAMAPVTQNFTDKIIPGITSQFAGSNRDGGSGAQQQFTRDATNDYDTTTTNAAATAGNNYFTSARGQQLTAAGMAPALYGADLGGQIQKTNLLGEAGGLTDAQSQAVLNSNMASYNYNSSAQLDYINKILASLNAAYPGGESTGSSSSSGSGYGTTTGTTAANPFSQIFGGALGLGSLGIGAKQAGLFG